MDFRVLGFQGWTGASNNETVGERQILSAKKEALEPSKDNYLIDTVR